MQISRRNLVAVDMIGIVSVLGGAETRQSAYSPRLFAPEGARWSGDHGIKGSVANFAADGVPV